jgi:hypothetical protein
VWHHTQREGVTGVTRVSQLSLSESLSLFFPLPPLPPRRQAHDRKLPSQAPLTSTCPVPGHSTVSAHGVERSMNAPAHRLAWNVLAYTHIRIF